MPVKPNTKMLVVMPYWAGDQPAAEAVARLCADLMTEPSADLGFLFVSRWDAPPPSQSVLNAMHEKFARVEHWRCNRKGVGFPMGPNEMYFGIFDHVSNPNTKLKEYDCIFILESDVVVTRRDWHLELIPEWDRAVVEGKAIVGNVIPHGYGASNEHVNASAIYLRNILRVIPDMIGCDGSLGWDWFFGNKTVPVAYHSNLFTLDYQRPNISLEVLYASGALVYHGVKDGSARDAVRKEMGIELPNRNMTIIEYAEVNNLSVQTNIDGSYTLRHL